MSNDPSTYKISPAFNAVLSRGRPDDKHEAIVIYRAAPVATPPVRGRLREIKRRLDSVRAQQAEHQSIEAKVFADYRKASGRQTASKETVGVSPIGGSSLPVAWAEVTRNTLDALVAQPDVIAVLPNLKIRLIEPKKVEYSELGTQEKRDKCTWGLKHLEAPKLWEKTKGKHINVAVLDTGVYGDHPALAGRVKEFVVIDPLGRRIETKQSFDAGQHGTHVCGTVAGGMTPEGVAIGMAPEATLLVAGVLVGQGTLRALVEGITWAVENGADIISMSLGFSYYEPLFAEIFDVLTQQYGILPVAAIGNENYGNTSSPGNVGSAFAVGALEKLPGGKTDVTFFSSGASLVFPGVEPQALVTKPDVVAPGAQILSSIPPERRVDGTWEYTYMDGTSMATPHVAGAAALLMAAKPQVPVGTIIQALKDTAVHPDGQGRRPDNRWGYGTIRPLEALKML